MKKSLILALAGVLILLLIAVLNGCGKGTQMDANKPNSNEMSTNSKTQPPENKNLREIWLAGGCFWGSEAYLAKLNGVVYTDVGYANGKTENPTYEQVTYRNTGHAETVYVKYDPAQISLVTLLTYYFKVVDPTSLNRQGNDTGVQYRTGIYYKNAADKATIDAVISQEQKKYAAPIVTEVLPLTNYYIAEAAHQQYLRKNPGGYCHINLSILDNDPIAKGK
jgi:methionine-S-sulfoxide reductase